MATTAVALDVLRELVDLGPRLDRLRSEGLATRGLTLPRVRLLFRLHDEGEMVSAELARRLELTPRAVTALVDGLEARGLVERKPHPSDRRATLIAPTAQGNRICRELKERTRRAADVLLSGASDSELKATLRALQRVRTSLETRHR